MDGFESGVVLFVTGSAGRYKARFWPQAVSMNITNKDKPIAFTFILFAITTT